MTLLLFKYVLPALLGYTLFVGISGRFDPMKKPDLLEERPSWMLGIWTGLCVVLVLGVGLHMAYGMPLESARELAKPAIWSLAGLLGAGFVAYLTYSHRVQADLNSSRIESGIDEIDWSSKVHQLDPLFNETSPAQSVVERVDGTERNIANNTDHIGAVIELSDQQLRRLQGESDAPKIAANEASKHEDLQATVEQLRKDLVASRHEVRKHVAARAKALSTANKSIAFARQTIELRAQLENELSSVRETLAVRQSTIARLIQRLETEQRLSDDELAVLQGYSALNDDNAAPTRLKDGTTN